MILKHEASCDFTFAFAFIHWGAINYPANASVLMEKEKNDAGETAAIRTRDECGYLGKILKEKKFGKNDTLRTRGCVRLAAIYSIYGLSGSGGKKLAKLN